MVVGLWESLPLRTLERRLLERNIADPATIKVNISHRKIVEISSTFVNVLEWGKDIFLKCGILSWKPPCHKWNMNNLQSAKTADCNDFRCDSVRWVWKWGMQNKQTRHRWSHLSMASYSSVLTWCLSYQSTLWPHFHHVETIRIFGIAACISLTEVTRLGINFKYFERLPLANFDEVS